jgi:hypothetical protein
MYPLRCSVRHQHGPHRVEARGTWTAFHCAGSLSRTDFERLLTEAFGCEAA